MTNDRIAAALEELVARLALTDTKPFRYAAFRKAAKVIRERSDSVAQLVQDGSVTELDGIGAGIEAALIELLDRGSFEQLDEAREQVADGLVELTQVSGIGPKSALAIWEHSNAESFEDVVQAARQGDLQEVPKVGSKAEQAIIEFWEQAQASPLQPTIYLRNQVRDTATAFADAGGLSPSNVVPIGEYVRGAESVERVELMVATNNPAPVVIETLVANGWVATDDESCVIAPSGRTVIFVTTPSLPDNVGDDEAAPKAIVASDLVADLHTHSTWTDGTASILEMARAARLRGDTHIVVTDHSAPYGLVNGLDHDRLCQQAEEIAEVNEQLAIDKNDGAPPFLVLHGSEVEIRADGQLGLSDKSLEMLDWVVASVHVSQRQSADALQERMQQVLDNPLVDCIGHPSSRLIGQRPPTNLDIEWLIGQAADRGVVLEINANPRRLDLKEEHARLAVATGVKLAINTDAHSCIGLDYRQDGVAIARAAGVQSKHVVNCVSADDLLAARRRRV